MSTSCTIVRCASPGMTQHTALRSDARTWARSICRRCTTGQDSARPTRRRLPPGKRLSQGYIPRPPNAFMLFRANFVRQKHVPGTIETNHGSLSKIIGEHPSSSAP